MKILFLSRWFPFPSNNGSKIRIANLLRALSQQHEVIFTGFSDDPQNDERNNEIHSLCKEVHLFQWKPYNSRNFRSITGFFNLAPRSIVDTFSEDLALQLKKAVTAGGIQAIIASQIDMASYAHCFSGLPAIFEEVETGLFYESQQQAVPVQQKLRSRLTWYKRKVYLQDLFSHFQAATVASDREREILRKSFPDYRNVLVIPNCIDFIQYQSVRETPNPESLIFTGSFQYSANYDAMNWFLSEIYPRIQAQIPGITLTITGDHANKPLPSYKNVNLLGFVDDIMPVISSAWCSLAPYRIGGGTRLKILEAMALGTPVIATAKGAEGLDVENGRHILIADTPEEYSAAVVRLALEPGLRHTIALNALELIKRKYDCQVVLPKFLELVDNLRTN